MQIIETSFLKELKKYRPQIKMFKQETTKRDIPLKSFLSQNIQCQLKH